MSNTPDAGIERQLNSGEKLLWRGQPRQGLRLRHSDLYMIPFSLLWCGFAIFWEIGATEQKAPLLFKCVGALFVFSGIYIVLGRFFVDAMIRTRTAYGITSDRIIIIRGLFNKQIQSLSLQDLFGLNLSERSDGSGTITFGPSNPLAQRFPAGFPGSTQNAAPAFEMIEHAKQVYDLLRQAEKSARGAGA